MVATRARDALAIPDVAACGTLRQLQLQCVEMHTAVCVEPSRGRPQRAARSQIEKQLNEAFTAEIQLSATLTESSGPSTDCARP
jgi:hypothetical protein